MSFQKRPEDFVCGHCGKNVQGNGYTNHCPGCLTSKHVDLDYPGDRSSPCQAWMRPVGIKLKGGQAWKILFRCEACQKEIFNLVAEKDNIDLLVKLPVLSA